LEHITQVVFLFFLIFVCTFNLLTGKESEYSHEIMKKKKGVLILQLRRMRKQGKGREKSYLQGISKQSYIDRDQERNREHLDF